MWRLFCRLGWHKRLRRKRFRDRDGLIKSRCRGCGQRMVRESLTGRWRLHDQRDRHVARQARRRPLEQLSAPVIFLILLGTLLAVTLLARGTYEGWH